MEEYIRVKELESAIAESDALEEWRKPLIKDLIKSIVMTDPAEEEQEQCTININRISISDEEFVKWFKRQILFDPKIKKYGNENENARLARRISRKIEQHPTLWHVFFKVK